MAYSRFERLQVGIEDGIATVRLNRPEQMNAIDELLHDELEMLWQELARDDAVNVILLTGNGRAFSAGGDVKAMAARARSPDLLKKSLRIPARARRLLASMLEVDQPIIAAINGDAIGLGATIALMCDITVMAEQARLGDTHVRVGLVAGDGGAVIWPMLIGLSRAKEMLMRARLVTGSEAAQMGLVNHAAPAEEVLAKATGIAREIAAMPTWAVRWTKVAANKELKQRLNLVLDAGMAYEMLSMQTKDFAEATQAFAERRKPSFSGE